jgi:hypothetical protein
MPDRETQGFMPRGWDRDIRPVPSIPDTMPAGLIKTIGRAGYAIGTRLVSSTPDIKLGIYSRDIPLEIFRPVTPPVSSIPDIKLGIYVRDIPLETLKPVTQPESSIPATSPES